MAGQIPQHDGEGRSATILPGVPLPDWALPAGPIEPEPEPEALVEPPAAPEPSVEQLPAPELVSVGAAGAAIEDTVAMAPLAPPAGPPSAPSPYGTAIPLGANGPGPMRAGWDYPGSDFRDQAHDEALAEAAEAAAATDVLDAAPDALDAPEAPDAPALEADAVVEAEALAAAAAPALPFAPPTGAPQAAPVEQSVEAPTAPAAEPSDAEASAPGSVDASDAAESSEDADGEEATGSSRRPLALLAVLGAVLVLGAVAAFVWPGLLVSSDPAPVPVVPQAAAPAAPAAPAAVELTTPASVGPYTKLSGAPDAALSKAVSGSTLPGLTAPVSAVYGTGTTPAVTVIAWKSSGPVGTDAVAAAFGGFQGATSAVVTGITTVPVSDGGQMQCGTTVVGGAPASLCFWGDEATFGSVTVLAPASPEAAADTATAVRAAVIGS